MGKFLRITGMTAVATLAVLTLMVLWLYRASQKVPEFYRDALEISPVTQRASGDELEKEVLQLRNDAQRTGRWEAVFTQEQINGWLAIDLPEKFPNTLPDDVGDPRVAINDGHISIACRYRGSKLETILSLTLEVSLSEEPNVLAVRFCKARAGTVPLPLRQWLDQIGDAANEAKIPLRWAKSGGDPVALVTIPRNHRELKNRALLIDTFLVRDGEIYLAGETAEEEKTKEGLHQAAADQAPPKRTVQ